MKSINNCGNCFWGVDRDNGSVSCRALAGKFGERVFNPVTPACNRWEAFILVDEWYLEVEVVDVVKPEDVRQDAIETYRRVSMYNANNEHCKTRDENLEIYNMTDDELRKYISLNKSPYIIFDFFKTEDDALRFLDAVKNGKIVANSNTKGTVKFIELISLKKIQSKHPLV